MRGLAVAVVAGLVLAPWLVEGYALHTAARIMAIGLLAVSVAVLTGGAGLPSMGQVAPYAVGAYTAGLLAKAGYTTGVVLLVASAATAALFSAIIAPAVVRTRGLYFLMITLAIGVLTATAADQLRGLTGGGDGLIGIPATQLWPGGPSLIQDRQLYWYALTVTAAAISITALIMRASPGMLLRASRDHELRARASGHPVNGYLALAYILAGALAGIGGALLITVQRFVSPADVGFHLAGLVLLAVIVGGAHSLWGSLAAAALVVTIQDWAAAGAPGHGPLVLGVLFIIAAFVLPRGVAGALSQLWAALTSMVDRRRCRAEAA